MNLCKSKIIFNPTANSKFNTMSQNNHLCHLWEHTIVKIFKHDPKSELGLILKQWVIFNKLENFNSILKYTIDDFTPSGNLCYINQNGEILHLTPMSELFNLRWYIQHLMDENDNPLSEQNWMKQTNWKFIMYVIHHKHSMTPEQLKQKPFKEVFKKQHKNLIQRKGSQMKRKRNLLHPQRSQNRILNLIQLKMKKSQIQHKQFKFTMF